MKSKNVLVIVAIICGFAVNAQQREMDVTTVVDIRENLYAGWQPVKEHQEAHNSLFRGYVLNDNGTAFGQSPAHGAFEGQDPLSGYQGEYLANSKNNNLGTTVGELLSDTFTIKGDSIDFLIAGGDFDKLSGIGLIVNNEMVRFSTGDFSNTLKRKGWEVTGYKNKTAQIMILDKIAKDPFCFPPFDSTKDSFGYILVDDIRQTDRNGNRTDSLYDQAHNFDFEKKRAPQYIVRPARLSSTLTRIDVLTADGARKGYFSYAQLRKRINGALVQIDHEWKYSGDSLRGIKLKVVNTIPISPDQTQYYMMPGLLYNGNNIGIRAHYLNENMPEDASTVPGGYSVEDRSQVFAGWVRPQESPGDPRCSIQLVRSAKNKQWQAIYCIPESVNMAVQDTLAQDEDRRFDVANGFVLKKTTFVYAGKKDVYSHISNEKAGYEQMISEAWKQLYPLSGTNPPHSLADDYRLKMKTLLDPKALVQDETVNGKKYRVWIVGRFILGEDFDFSQSQFVPRRYIFDYTGFSWSGMLEVAAYNGIKEYLRTRDTAAVSLAVNSIDFFADNGMSPIGILYPNWDSAIGFSSVWARETIDIGHLGDGLSGIIKCYRLMRDSGIAVKANWLNVVTTSLDNMMKRFPDGDVPGRIHGNSGEAAVRDGILYKKPSLGGPNGINFLIWAYCDYYDLTKQRKYLEYARKMGDIVLKVMNEYGVMSGMEADYFNVDKRMFHGALAAFNRLYQHTGDKKWLEASIQAGNAFGSWEYCYNVNFKGYPETPNGHYDYRSVGGTPVDIKYSTNNTNFQQGATEFLKLWRSTGDPMWFERARAIMHQGTQLSLTEDKRKWLNSNAQVSGSNTMHERNLPNTFDSHVLGGGTEDVMMSWLFKGIWTSRFGGIISMYMLTQGFDSDDLLREYGALCYSFKYRNGGAIDALDDVTFTRSKDGRSLSIAARNMLPATSTYTLKLLDLPDGHMSVDGKAYDKDDMSRGIPITFDSHEKRVITVRIF